MKNRNFLHAAILLIITIIVYNEVSDFGFTNWDDDKYVYRNEIIQQFDIQKAFSGFTVGLYTPVVTLSYMLDYQLFGLNPAGYHVENLVLHLVVSVLVFLFVRKWLQSDITAWLAAFLFALHPIHVEPVAWISSRKDLLYSLFYLLGLITYLNYGEGKKTSNLILTILFFLLSLLSKPAAVSFPLVISVLALHKMEKRNFKSLLHLIPFYILALAIGLVTIYGASELGLRKTPDTGYSLIEYILIAFHGISFYIQKIVLPVNLSHYYVYPLPGEEFSSLYWFGPVALLLLGVLVYYLQKKDKTYLYLSLISFLMLIPMWRFVPVGYPMVADRYFYLSSMGLLCIPAYYISNLESKSIRISAISISGIVTVLFAFLSYQQTAIWENSLSLWKGVTKQHPNFYFAYQEIGRYYEEEVNNPKAALANYRKALQIQPNDPYLLSKTSNLTIKLGNTTEAKKMQDAAIEIKNDAASYYNRGNTYKAEGNCTEAIKDYTAALDRDSTLAQAYNNRGICYVLSGDTINAFQDFERAVQLEGTNQMFIDNYNRLRSLIE